MSEKSIWMAGGAFMIILLMTALLPYTAQAYLIMGINSLPLCGG